MQNNTTANLHLIYQDDQNGYAAKLLPPPSLIDKLKACQIKVRNKLERVLEQEYGIKPKFRVQGSFAYGTCNIPAQPDKGQELDLDYGAYLPVRVFTINEEDDQPNSAEEAMKYIEIVFKALSELALENSGWSVEQKPSCIRISGIGPYAHMDVPLYAVPNDMFKDIENQHQLVTDAAQKSSFQKRFESSSLSMEAYDSALNSEIYENESLIDLESIKMIHMAKEDGTWFPSDCEKVREWFKQKCLRYPNKGRQLRFIARYLKGWRDQQWEEKGPTSIVLMIATVQNYEYIQGRDDLALAKVTTNLDTILGNNIYVADMEDHEDEDFNRADIHQRKENAQAARNLHQNVTQAIEQGILKPNASIELLKSSFGNRIPNETTLIRFEHQNPVENILQAQSTTRENSVRLKPQSSG